VTIAQARERASYLQIGCLGPNPCLRTGALMRWNWSRAAKKPGEPPVAYRGAPPDSERASQPPLPEPPYQPYPEKTLPEARYEPYAKKPGVPEVVYEPYKDI
jgi:hypothetical protein